MFWIIVIVIIVLICCIKKKGNKQTKSAVSIEQVVSERASISHSMTQTPSTYRQLSGNNEDYAYIFGSMVAALGATGYIQIGGNGTVFFEAGSFGENWSICKANLPQNVYSSISASSALTDKTVGQTRVMKYKPQGKVTCSLESSEKWQEDVEQYLAAFEKEIKQGYADTHTQKRALSFRQEIYPETQYAVLWVAK